MTLVGWLQIIVFIIVLLALTKPVGILIAKIANRESFWLDRIFGHFERFIYRLMGIDPNIDMFWQNYTYCLIAFSALSCIFTYLILRLQGFLPLNPMAFSTMLAPTYASKLTPDLAFNIAISFATNTNWQSYAGENTLSYLSQMLALAFQNWISAATGIAVAFALIRGFILREAKGIGNFWVDLVRSTIYILLPICFVSTLFFVSQGIIQNFSPYVLIETLEGTKQILPQGPVASQEAIKLLGTNGGGFFNANSAHPFENPTPLTNFFEMLLILLIPSALTYTLGNLLKDTRQGWTILAAMLLIFLIGVSICYNFECAGNPNISQFGINTSTHSLNDHGGNMEGKEMRFGVAASSLFTTVTTAASCGAVNCMHDSLTPLAGLIPLLNIQLGEIIFGGVGSGLYGILIFAIITVFISGLMVGRTPEYLGKKIEQKEVKMAMLYVLTAAISILALSAFASTYNLPQGNSLNPPGATFNNINNGGPHGLTEILYAFSSASGNNGSAFAGLNANTPFYNIALAIAMWAGRFLMIVPVLAIAGSLASKKYIPITTGTLPTHGILFVIMLVSVIFIVGALTFFPALTLGPIVEHLLMKQGYLF